jgi:hypothetical protein
MLSHIDDEATRPIGGSAENRSIGLPEGAEIYDSLDGTRLVRSAWGSEMRLYANTGRDISSAREAFTGYEVDETGFGSKFWGKELFQTVGGHCYYSAYAVKTEHGIILLYRDWMRPMVPGGALYPLIATMGSVPEDEVKIVLTTYALNIFSKIDAIYNDVDVSEQQRIRQTHLRNR